MTLRTDAPLTGVERTFAADEIIVTKTDPQGKLTYANDIFINISGYTEDELLCQPHSMIRHSHMPRSIFKLLWETIEGGREIFAYVINRAKNGDHYWVLAHVTPNLDPQGQIIGYHSSRRIAQPKALAAIRPLYQRLRTEEERSADRKAGLAASYAALQQLVTDSGLGSYDRFIRSL